MQCCLNPCPGFWLVTVCMQLNTVMFLFGHARLFVFLDDSLGDLEGEGVINLNLGIRCVSPTVQKMIGCLTPNTTLYKGQYLNESMFTAPRGISRKTHYYFIKQIYRLLIK